MSGYKTSLKEKTNMNLLAVYNVSWKYTQKLTMLGASGAGLTQMRDRGTRKVFKYILLEILNFEIPRCITFTHTQINKWGK